MFFFIIIPQNAAANYSKLPCQNLYILSQIWKHLNRSLSTELFQENAVGAISAHPIAVAPWATQGDKGSYAEVKFWQGIKIQLMKFFFF